MKRREARITNEGDMRHAFLFGMIAEAGMALSPGQEIELVQLIGSRAKWKYEDNACCTTIATAHPNRKMMKVGAARTL